MSRKFVFMVVSVLCLSFVIIGAKAHDPSYEIVAVYGSTPTIDGAINIHEWSDAASVFFNNTEVFVKQDGVNLYIGFNNSEAQFHDEDTVGVIIDVDHDAGLTLQPDDIGMIVWRNGTLWEANVTEGAWTIANTSGWTASVHFTSDMWQVEFNITYPKINVIAGVEKTLGVVFQCNRRWELSYPFSWPPGYMDIYTNPSMWGVITSTGYDWIPEFPSFLVLPIFMITTLLLVIVYRRRTKNVIF